MPSIFHVKEENDVGEDSDEEDGEEASTARVGLSEHCSLSKAEEAGFEEYLA